MGLQTNIKVSSNAFFKNLSVKAERVAGEAARDRAYLMRDILRYRKSMYSDGSSNARYPRWGGTKRDGEDHSYTGWYVNMKSGNQFYLTNPVVNVNDNYQYPNILAYGMGPNGNPKWTRETDKIVRGPNGRLFSRQMPRGIQPWVEHQRGLMKIDIKKAIGGLDGIT